VDLSEYRNVSYAIWQQMAEGWDRRRDWMWQVSRPVGEDMIARLDPQPGQTILELAAGPGETGFAAAALVGEQGRVISTDFSPAMVEAAGRRAQELGLENVETHVMDAENMDLDADSADGVLCRWGYMLMADPAKALAETRRVLRSGGRLVFSVWGGPEMNPWAAIAGAVLVQRGHVTPPQPGDPGIFAMASADRISELVMGAGFGTPEIDDIEIEYRFENADEYWDFLTGLAGGLALTIKDLDEEERQAVRLTIQSSAQDYRSGDALVMPGVCRNVLTS
jgi:ubiquinone/menaquinone biosynthesis C-methylase UbiE